jgi:hypothetical protein
MQLTLPFKLLSEYIVPKWTWRICMEDKDERQWREILFTDIKIQIRFTLVTHSDKEKSAKGFDTDFYRRIRYAFPLQLFFSFILSVSLSLSLFLSFEKELLPELFMRERKRGSHPHVSCSLLFFNQTQSEFCRFIIIFSSVCLSLLNRQIPFGNHRKLYEKEKRIRPEVDLVKPHSCCALFNWFCCCRTCFESRSISSTEKSSGGSHCTLVCRSVSGERRLLFSLFWKWDQQHANVLRDFSFLFRNLSCRLWIRWH